jgi:hypothetical protein
MAGKARKSQHVEIADPAAMRALAHPLKWALMEVLLVEGSATSTRCAELVGDTQANCSFHLRQLARYGLVEPAPTTSKRDRPWRLASTDQSWSTVQPDEVSTRAASELERVFIQHELAKLMRWKNTEHTYPEAWRRAALRAGSTTWLTDAEMAELGDAIAEVMLRFRDRLDDPAKRPKGARPVRLFAVGYPLHDDSST